MLLVPLDDRRNNSRANRELSRANFVPTCACVFGEAFVPSRADKKAEYLLARLTWSWTFLGHMMIYHGPLRNF